MRVEVKTETRKKERSSLGLLALIAMPFVFGYFLASPAITAHLPHTMERALTNYRDGIDKAIDSAFASARDRLGMVGLRW